MGKSLRQVLQDLEAPNDQIESIVGDYDVGDRTSLLRFLFLRLMWNEVIAEDREGPVPGWIGQWQRLSETDFPFLNVEALQRLLDQGADADDLTDLVRSAQALLIYNLANQLDDGWGALRRVLPEELRGTMGWSLVATDASAPEPPDVIAGLHGDLEELDPAGRGGAPRTLVERRFQRLPEEVRTDLIANLRTAKAALVWRRHTGDDLDASRHAVSVLAHRYEGNHSTS